MVKQLKKGPKTKQEWIVYSSELENQLRQAQNELSQAKEETSLLIRHAPTAIYEIDLAAPRFHNVNDAMCQMSGYSREELLAMSPFDMLDEAGKKILQERFRKNLSGEPVDPFVEYKITAKDGRTIYAVLISSIQYREGKPHSAFVIGYDVTERKQLETALAAEQEQLATIFAAQQDIVLLYGPDMHVRRVNSAFQETYGFDPVGMHVNQIIQLVSCRNLDGRPLDLSRQPTPQALKGEKVARARFLVQRCDGRDQIVETSASPIWRGNDITGSVTVWHDITELQQIRQTLEKANTTLQNQAEELEVQTEELKQQTDDLIFANRKLAESERKYALLFGKSAVASTLTKLPEKTFVDVNEAFERLFGYSRKELIGKTSIEVGIVKPAEYAVTVAEVEKKGRQHDAEKHFRTQSGAEIIALVNVDSLEINREQFAITTIQDITERKQMEAALRKSEKHERERASELAAIMDTVPAMIWISRDPQCQDMVGNRYGFEFLQMGQDGNISKTAPADDQAKQSYKNFKDGKEIPTAELPMQIAAATGIPAKDYEFDLVFANGGVKTVFGNVVPLWDEQQHSSGAVAAFIDITERVQAEERIQRQNILLAGINRIFQKALTCQTEEELGQVCLAVTQEVTASQFGFIGEINPQTGKLDGLAISDPGWEACRMPAQTGQGYRVPIDFTIHGIYGRVLLDGRSLFTNDPVSHPDAIGVPTGHPPLHAFLGVPLLNDGKTMGMIGLGNRVGGYGPEELSAAEALAPAIVQAIFSKRAEVNLRASQERERLRAAQLEAVMEALPIGMAITDEKGGNFQSNRTFEQTWEGPRPKVDSIKDYAAYKAWWADSGEEVKPEEWASAQAVQNGETVIGQFFEIRQFDGSRRYVLNSASPVKDANGKILGSAVAIQDITSLHEAEQKLEQVNVLLEQRVRERTAELEQSLQTERLLRQQLIQTEKFAALARLVGSVAHEINNPLQTVKNCLFLIKDEKDPHALEEELSLAVGEIRRISDLVQLMRQSYRPSGPQPIDFNLIELFSRVKALLEPQFRQLNVVWSFAKNRDCMTIHGNPDQIQQVILNICLNALDAMSDAGGTLQVSVKRLARLKKVQMTFHDTGPGICKEDLDRIFEPFYSTKAKGTGLGLAICYEIVKNHQGEIVVESEPGSGATFKVLLPES